MKLRWILLLVLLIDSRPLSAEEAGQAAALILRLQSPDETVKYAALRSLQTSLDPRIAEACLPILKSEGESIRRLAARAIGSRWHQIPQERSPIYTAALRPHAKSQNEGLANMAVRGIDLLERTYKSPMVSRSASQRWVIYERRGLPCLIDTKTMTEELLGFPAEEKLICAYGNTKTAPTVIWHPRKDRVAMRMIQDRHHTTVWVWLPGKGLCKLPPEQDLHVLRGKDGKIGVRLYLDPNRWVGDSLDLTADYLLSHGGEYMDRSVHLRWNPDTGTIQVAPP